MRGVFGLLSLLIAAAIVAYLWSSYGGQVLTSGHSATIQAQQIAGRGDDGTPAINSVSLEPKWDAARHFGKLVVKEIQSGGAMEKYYGLQKNDEIIAIGPQEVRDFSDDIKYATDMLADAYQKSRTIVIQRASAELTLPANSDGAAGQPLQNQVKQMLKSE